MDIYDAHFPPTNTHIHTPGRQCSASKRRSSLLTERCWKYLCVSSSNSITFCTLFCHRTSNTPFPSIKPAPP